MIYGKKKLCVLGLFLLAGCSSFGRSDKDKKPLEGERISVLELQKDLAADAPLKVGERLDLPAPWPNASWPQAGGYPNHSMQNLAFSSDPPKKIWSAHIGKGSTRSLPLTAHPVVADGLVFTLDTHNKVSAFDANTGKTVWTADVRKKKEDDPVISGGLAFAYETLFVTNGYDEILALSPKDGKVLWRKILPAPSRAAPTILSGRAYVSTLDSRLVALDTRDGSSQWEYRGIGEAAGLLGAASPAANRSIVLPVFSSGEVTALRVENGAVAWSDNLSSTRRFGLGLDSLSDITAMPVIDQGVIVVISYSGRLVAIDERTGMRLWNREIGGTKTPWVVGNTLYVLSSDNELVALNLFDGAIRWITELKRFEDEDDKEGLIHWSAPIMGGSRLILAGSNGQLIEISPHNGDILRHSKTRKDVRIAPLIADQTLYLLANDGTLSAYR